MSSSDQDKQSSDTPAEDELDAHPPGPADRGGHGGMATREVEAAEADESGADEG